MDKRNYLVPVGVALAALTVGGHGAASAAAAVTAPSVAVRREEEAAVALPQAVPVASTFALPVGHTSHSSHSSHSSHVSHSSHFSSSGGGGGGSGGGGVRGGGTDDQPDSTGAATPDYPQYYEPDSDGDGIPDYLDDYDGSLSDDVTSTPTPTPTPVETTDPPAGTVNPSPPAPDATLVPSGGAKDDDTGDDDRSGLLVGLGALAGVGTFVARRLVRRLGIGPGITSQDVADDEGQG
jgi:hypothetical protein